LKTFHSGTFNEGLFTHVDDGNQDQSALSNGQAQQHLEHLQRKYDDLARRHAETEKELHTLVSSSAVSTSAVLSDMYIDLEKNYEQLEAAYKREMQSHQTLKADHQILQTELKEVNQRLLALQRDLHAQQRTNADMQLSLHDAKSIQQHYAAASDQCAALQVQLEQARELQAATEEQMERARLTIENLKADLRDSNRSSEDLSQQVSCAHSFNCNSLPSFLFEAMCITRILQMLATGIRNKVVSERLESFISLFEESSAASQLDGSDQHSMRFQGSTSSVVSDNGPSFFSPKSRPQTHSIHSSQGVLRSILVENVELATSLQIQNNRLKDASQALEIEHQRNAQLASERDDFKRLLEISRESEQRSILEAEACESRCNATIHDIRDKVSDAWAVEEHKQRLMESQIDALKEQAKQLTSAQKLIAELQQRVAEHDEQMARIQTLHESEKEHAKLLHEEDIVMLKQKHENALKQASVQVDQVEEKMKSFEAAVALQVKEATNALQTRHREDQQRFSAQIDDSLKSLKEAQDQRALLIDKVAAQTLLIDELNEHLRASKKELSNKSAEIEFVRQEMQVSSAELQARYEQLLRAKEIDISEMQRLFTQKQDEDRQALDAGWSALHAMRKEIEESVLVNSRIQFETALSKTRQMLASDFAKCEEHIQSLQHDLAAAGLDLKLCQSERDELKERLEASQEELKSSKQLQGKMQKIEESFLALRANLDAGARREAQLNEVIEQQKEAAVISDALVKQLESRIKNILESNSHADLSHQEALNAKDACIERLERNLAANADHVSALQSSIVQLKASQQDSDVLQQKLQSSSLAEAQLKKNLQLQADMSAASESRILLLESQVAHLEEQLRRRDGHFDAVIKERDDLLEQISREKSASKAARDLMLQTMQTCAEDRISLQKLQGVAEELNLLKQHVEKEAAARDIAQKDLQLLKTNLGGVSLDLQVGDVMQAARAMLLDERARFEKEQDAERARSLELHLELEKCKLQLRQKEAVAKSNRSTSDQ
jgi:hypothetical protein